MDGLRRLGIQSADFYLEFDETTAWSRETVVHFIKGLNIPSVQIYNFRLSTFSHWKAAADLLDENPADQLLLYTNDDHVLVNPSDIEFLTLKKLQKQFQEDLPGQVVMVPLSHFPEQHALLSVSAATGTLKLHKGSPLIPCQIPAVPILISKHKFQSFWHVDFTNGNKFVGLENPFGPSLRLTEGLYIPPRIEILRHLDSYGHVGVNRWPFQPLEPNVIVDAKPPYNVSFEGYLQASHLDQPRFGHSRTIPVSKSGNLDEGSLSLALYMSSRMRPSLTSLRWTASAFDEGKASFRMALMRLAQIDINSLLPLLIPHRFRPGFIALRALHRVTERIPSKKLKDQYLSYLTYGSSIGYLRLFWFYLTTFMKLVLKTQSKK